MKLPSRAGTGQIANLHHAYHPLDEVCSTAWLREDFVMQKIDGILGKFDKTLFAFPLVEKYVEELKKVLEGK